MTAFAYPTVLRKQRPKRRGVGAVVQRSSVRKRKRKPGRRSPRNRVGVEIVRDGIPGICCDLTKGHTINLIM